MKRQLAGILLFALFGSSAQAALQSRLSGQAYYDTVLNITWRPGVAGGGGVRTTIRREWLETDYVA